MVHLLTRRVVRLGSAALLALVLGITTALATATEQPTKARASSAAGPRPNIVLILMDDFSMELLRTMPQAREMAREGASYRHSYVIDSLCCPSRASTFTGQTPHQTGVLTNTPNDAANPIGGFAAYRKYGNLDRSFNLALQKSGYTTGFVGKFLNQYEPRHTPGGVKPPPDIPGWSEFNAITGGGYNGWGYKSTYRAADGSLKLRDHPRPDRSQPERVIDRSYSGHVAADLAVDFLNKHRDEKAPYFLEVATYAPHSQLDAAYPDNPLFPPAFRDRAPNGAPGGGNCGARECADLRLKDLRGYDDDRDDNRPTYLRRNGTTSPAPAWRTNPITLTADRALTNYRDRARMVQSVDRLIKRVRAAAGPNTYVFLTADNGFHLGQHQLNGGKGTPYDSDARVPMLVVGPKVVPGKRRQFVSNVDLAPTFERLAGLAPPGYRSGISFTSSLRRPKTPGGKYVFYEHTYSKSQPGEVDTDEGSGGTIDIIPSFIGVRTERGLLVRFDLDKSWKGTDYAWELYRYDRPWEDRNVFAEDHRKPWVRDLMRRIRQWQGCAAAECRSLTR